MRELEAFNDSFKSSDLPSFPRHSGLLTQQARFRSTDRWPRILGIVTKSAGKEKIWPLDDAMQYDSLL